MCGISFKVASVNDFDQYFSSVTLREKNVPSGRFEVALSFVFKGFSVSGGSGRRKNTGDEVRDKMEFMQCCCQVFSFFY